MYLTPLILIDTFNSDWSPGAFGYYGYSPGLAGRTLIFTDYIGDNSDLRLKTIIHEFVHAFGLQHKCGNYDYTGSQGCLMNYPENFLLNDQDPREPIQWTDHNLGCLCAPHILSIRQSNLEDLDILNW